MIYFIILVFTCDWLSNTQEKLSVTKFFFFFKILLNVMNNAWYNLSDIDLLKAQIWLAKVFTYKRPKFAICKTLVVYIWCYFLFLPLPTIPERTKFALFSRKTQQFLCEISTYIFICFKNKLVILVIILERFMCIRYFFVVVNRTFYSPILWD